MRMVEVGFYLLPEIGHRGKRIVTTHGPHGIGIRTSEQNAKRVTLQGQQTAVVLQQNYRLRRYIIGCLALFRGIEFDVALGIEIRLLVKQTSTILITQHVFHGTLQHLRLNQSLVDSLL